MISSSTLAAGSALDLKTTQSLPLSKTSGAEFGKSTKQPLSLPQSNSEATTEQPALKRYVEQVIEQQIHQLSNSDKPAEAQAYKPQAEPPLELLDLEASLRPDPQLAKRKSLGLNPSPSKATSERNSYQPLTLSDPLSRLDIQLLTENNDSALSDPNERFLQTLQHWLPATHEDKPLYWIEKELPASATQVATDTSKPNLAWKESLWF